MGLRKDEGMITIKKIFFDMDGVLADFDRGVRELCGIEPPVQRQERYPGEGDYLWAKVREVEHFYDKLELMSGAKEMFDSLYAEYGDRCEILTGIPKPRRGILSSGEDKTKWVRRLLSEDIKVNIVYREQKGEYCTGEDCILIDDYEKNIDSCQHFAAGYEPAWI